MTNKLMIAAALLLLTFAASDATTAHKSKIEMIYQPQPNGDFRLSLYGSDRTLVCEEQALKIVQDGDAINLVVIECKHSTAPVHMHRRGDGKCWHRDDNGVDTPISCDTMRVH